jgi:hypothetical protein
MTTNRKSPHATGTTTADRRRKSRRRYVPSGQLDLLHWLEDQRLIELTASLSTPETECPQTCPMTAHSCQRQIGARSCLVDPTMNPAILQVVGINPPSTELLDHEQVDDKLREDCPSVCVLERPRPIPTTDWYHSVGIVTISA